MKFGVIPSVICLLGVAASRSLPPAHMVPALPNKVAATWFAGWHENEFGPKNVSWTKYTHVIYSFAVTTQDPQKLDESGLTGLPDFVQTAHKHGVKAVVSLGGWTGSRFFSTAFNSGANRAKFLKTIKSFVSKYKLDGLDFDWEYPNAKGVGCNTLSPDDTSNFLLFLHDLRADPVGKLLSITAAVGVLPWLGKDGKPVTDVRPFAEVLDYVAIMNYDVWGPWSSTVGPNAPLDDSCAPSTANRAGSATSAINAWTKAGMPSDRIVLGIPAYGHSFRVRKAAAYVGGQLALFPHFDAKDQPAGDRWDGEPGTIDACGVKSEQPSGLIQYWGMIDLGYLNKDGSPRSGKPYRFDSCSKTPFIYNPEKEIMVSYDDPKSMTEKGKFIKDHGLRGFSMWEAAGDYKDSLLDAVRRGAGYISR